MAEKKAKENKFKINFSTIIIITFIIGILIGYSLSSDSSTQENTTQDHGHSDLKVSCEVYGGNWIEDTLECENIAQESCEELEGKYNSCASACRNTNSEICTMQCVEVCDLTSHHEDEMDMSHSHEKYEVFENEPQIQIEVSPDNKSGYNLEVITQNFEFTPQEASREHVDNHGHAHIYVNDVKINRLYSNWYYLGELNIGDEIRVTLNTNDHKEYFYNQSIVEDLVIIN